MVLTTVTITFNWKPWKVSGSHTCWTTGNFSKVVNMLKWLQWISNRNWHVAYWIVPLPDLEQPSVISVGTAEKPCLCTRCVSCFVIPECLDWYNIIEILTDVEGNGNIYYQGRRPRAIIWKPRANISVDLFLCLCVDCIFLYVCTFHNYLIL